MRQGARVGAKARARRGLRVALGFGCRSDTRISSAKLLSSPSRALIASKSNTNCARQQAQCDWGRCSSHGSGRRELPRTCGSVASPLSSGAFSVVRTRPAGKTNKVAADRRARVRAERRTWCAHLARRRDEIQRRCCYRGRHLHVPDPGQRRRQVAASGRYPPRDVFGGEAASASLTTHSAKIIPKRRKATGATYAEQHPTSSMLAVAGLHEPSLTGDRWLCLHQALGRSGRALSRPRRATGRPTSTT